MAIFKKKTTLVHHIAYMGLMTAINIIFVVLASFLSSMMVLLILLLPFSSAIVSYFCKKRFYIIYAVASIGICLLIDPVNTIFYIVPAVISGFVIGVLLDNNVHPFWLVLCSSIINTAFSLAFIPLINLLGGFDDIASTILKALKLDGFAYKLELVFLFVYFLSLLQCALTHFVLVIDAKKIGIEVKEGMNNCAPLIVGLELFTLLSLAFSFFFTPLAFVFLAISIYFSTFVFMDLLMSKKIIVYVLLFILLLGSLILFAVFYQRITAPLGLMLVLLFPMSIGITSFIKNYLLKSPSNI